ncbi:MAG TPA: hypothetical protein VMS96_07345 [Terriglobales bacterium]|nr:hypothetical protein [Terriglobales bacterium]
MLLICLILILLPRPWWRTRGYAGIRQDIYGIARLLQGAVERDGTDVLVVGNRHGRRVFVRFSASELEPPLQIRVPIASSLVLFCTPTSYRQPIATESKLFPDSRGGPVRIWSAKPAEANLVLTPEVRRELATLCTVSGLFSVENRECVLSVPDLPASPFAGTVASRIDKVLKIATAADSMPDTEPLRAVSAPFSRAWIRTAEIVAILVLAATTIGLGRLPAPKAPPGPPVPSGVPAADAARIHGLQGWTLMQSGDFDSNARSWLQQAGIQASGQPTVAMGPEGTSTRVYALRSVTDPGKARVVILRDEDVVFDTELPSLALLARVPVREFDSARWRSDPPPVLPDGDGLLLVFDYQRPESGIVVFLQGPKTISLNPADFRSLRL